MGRGHRRQDRGTEVRDRAREGQGTGQWTNRAAGSGRKLDREQDRAEDGSLAGLCGAGQCMHRELDGAEDGESDKKVRVEPRKVTGRRTHIDEDGDTT
jgi:hypothetical protein